MLKIEIIVSDKNAAALKATAKALGTDPERVVLLGLLIATGEMRMTSFLQIKATMDSMKNAGPDLRAQVGEVLGAGLDGELTGRDFSTALGELQDLVEDRDVAWTPEVPS